MGQERRLNPAVRHGNARTCVARRRREFPHHRGDHGAGRGAILKPEVMNEARIAIAGTHDIVLDDHARWVEHLDADLPIPRGHHAAGDPRLADDAVSFRRPVTRRQRRNADADNPAAPRRTGDHLDRLDVDRPAIQTFDRGIRSSAEGPDGIANPDRKVPDGYLGASFEQQTLLTFLSAQARHRALAVHDEPAFVPHQDSSRQLMLA